MRLAWLTDVHLNFVKDESRQAFYLSISEVRPDAVLIGGDISEAPDVVERLHEIERAVRKPIYFVLGNHDFYRSSMEKVQARIRKLATPPNLIWLTEGGVQLLNESTALIGDDSWADGRLGNYLGSQIFLNDYLLIEDFAGLDKAARLRLLNQLGDAAAMRVRTKLNEACAQRGRIVLLTHVPPFRESAWHEGRASDEDWLPHFASKAVGEVIVEVMDRHPNCNLEVLCGHTHGAGIAQIRPNVIVKTGGAVYRHPVVQGVLEV